MTFDPSTAANFASARLVPELLVTDVNSSLHFWRDLCGFSVAFDRLHEGFAYLDLDGAQVMLEERGRSRNWIVGPMEVPFGRGINFQIEVRAIAPILGALAATVMGRLDEREIWPEYTSENHEVRKI